jgi:hypothetical protein
VSAPFRFLVACNPGEQYPWLVIDSEAEDAAVIADFPGRDRAYEYAAEMNDALTGTPVYDLPIDVVPVDGWRDLDGHRVATVTVEVDTARLDANASNIAAAIAHLNASTERARALRSARHLRPEVIAHDALRLAGPLPTGGAA